MAMFNASRPTNEDILRYVYLVKWQGCSHKEDTSETYDNVIEHVEELLEEYFEKNENTEKVKRFVQRKSTKTKDAKAQLEKNTKT